MRQRERREREGGFGRLFGLARYELMKTPPRWVACARAVIEYLVEWEQGGPAAIVTIDTDRPLENGPAPVSSQKASLKCRREIFRLWVAHLKPLRQGLE